MTRHARNKRVLEKAGFIITNFVDSANVMILEAYHPDGRTVKIRV